MLPAMAVVNPSAAVISTSASRVFTSSSTISTCGIEDAPSANQGRKNSLAEYWVLVYCKDPAFLSVSPMTKRTARECHEVLLHYEKHAILAGTMYCTQRTFSHLF